jgi:hypothetical protein
MIKRLLLICVCVFAVADALAQSPAKQVKQPGEVIEAYRVCSEFQRILAENLDFDRAFEATFVKDPARRREVAIAEGEHGNGDLSQVDTATIVAIFKTQAQGLILMLPLLFADGQEDELFPPSMKAAFDVKPPDDPQKLQAYAAELQRHVIELRAHVEKLAAGNPTVAKNREEYKKHLLKVLEPPNRVVKPLTAYSKGKVLLLHEKYYQIDDCAVIREDGHMKLVGYIFLRMRG